MNCFFKRYTAVLAISLATSFATALQADDNFESIAEFDEWALFQDEGACWITSNPVFITKPEQEPENYYMFVSFFFGSAEPEISYYFSGSGGDDLVAYAGEEVSDLFFHEDTYYPYAEEDISFLMAMLKSDRVSIHQVGSDVPEVKFSLDGFREAYNEAARVCEFNSFDTDNKV
jgi:hypothetical protein